MDSLRLADGVVVAAATACIGTPFRPQGRLAGTGLDCVGLVLHALAAAGRQLPATFDHVYDGSRRHDVSGALAGLGLRPRAGTFERPGDVAIFDCAPGPLHFGIIGAVGLIHADQTIGRVVRCSRRLAWPRLPSWTLSTED